jgi:hypothetical protein
MANGERQWATEVIRGLGKQPTERAVSNLIGWARAEGGHTHNDARYNYLNTTQPMPGAGNTGSQGNIKVYRNLQQGVQATVKTLKNGRYGGIINALDRDPASLARAITSSPWGTKNPNLAGIIASAAGQKPASGSYQYGSSQAQDSAPVTTTIDRSGDRQQALLSYLDQRHNPDALLALGTQLKSLQDITTTTPGSPSTSDSGMAPSGGGGQLDAIINEANQIDKAHLPYQWGGGHNAQNKRGAKLVPLDCSGAVSRALGVNARVSGQFAKWGAPGPGSKVTIYANSTHVLMKIGNRFWGTSSTNPGGGAGWIPASAISKDYLKRFTARHPPGL